MHRKHFISKPWVRSPANEGNPSWLLYAACDWAINVAYPPMTLLAACVSEDAVLAAKRLLLSESSEERHE